jgi:hypothetical protein
MSRRRRESVAIAIRLTGIIDPLVLISGIVRVAGGMRSNENELSGTDTPTKDAKRRIATMVPA